MQIKVERWYIEMLYNTNNSPAYVDMVKDMEAQGNGVFSCTFKLNDGNICDYVVMENGGYVKY